MPPKRKSYTADFKLRVVRELSVPPAATATATAAQSHLQSQSLDTPARTQPTQGGAPSVRSLAARHGITPSMLRKWVSSRAELEAAVLGQRAGASGSSAQLRKLGSGRPPESREVDAALAAWVRRQRALGVAVKDREMQVKARALAAERGMASFRASKGYVCKFKARHMLGAVETRSSISAGDGRASVSDAVWTDASGRPAGACLFGMDIGTMAVRCAVVSVATGGVLETSSAAIEQSTGAAGAEEPHTRELTVSAVLLAARSAIQQLPVDLRTRITSIGVCGRMHGILWWRSDAVAKAVDQLFSTVPSGLEAPTGASVPRSGDLHAWSKYITALDRRCSPAFVEQCRARIARGLKAAQPPVAGSAGGDGGGGRRSSRASPLAVGYGLASFAYMMEHAPRELVGFDACGTIQDLVAFALCRHSLPAQCCMDTTNAFSWGGFDLQTNDWNPHAVAALELPLHMLPAVRAPGHVIGYSNAGAGASTDAFGLPTGTPVYIPMGEHPCTVVAAIAQAGPSDAAPSLAVATIGAATQLAVVLSAQDVARLGQRAVRQGFEVRPFLSERHFLGVTATLSGGDTFAWFVRQCLEWSRDLAVDPSFNQLSEREMYARLIAQGDRRVATDLEFQPPLHGEREGPDAHGAIHRLRAANWSVGDIGAAICKGVVDNLFAVVPREITATLPDRQVVGTGAAVVRNALFQHFLAKKAADTTGRALKVQEMTDAAVGVALAPSLLQRNDWRGRDC